MRRCPGRWLMASFLMLAFDIIAADGQKLKTRNAVGRIFGGALAKQEDTMHQVSLREFEDAESYGWGHLCGGSLISRNVVLTATHCFRGTKPHNATVVMGNLDRFNKLNTLSFNIEHVTTHPGDNDQFENDITLVYLNGSVPSDAVNIRPIKINRRTLEYGAVCQVTGWGFFPYLTQDTEQEMLLTLDVPIVDCSKSKIPKELILPGMMCAGSLNERKKGACHGDSGGPLVCKGLLAGVVSWGHKGLCGKKGLPTVFVNVSYYQNWIDQYVPEIRDKEVKEIREEVKEIKNENVKEIKEEGPSKKNTVSCPPRSDLPLLIVIGSIGVLVTPLLFVGYGSSLD